MEVPAASVQMCEGLAEMTYARETVYSYAIQHGLNFSTKQGCNEVLEQHASGHA